MHFAVLTIWSYLFSPRSPSSSNNRTRVRDSGKCCTRCIRHNVVILSAATRKHYKQHISTSWNQEMTVAAKLTASSFWKITIRPPLSPVARSSPSWLNSTVETISAERQQNVNMYNCFFGESIKYKAIGKYMYKSGQICTIPSFTRNQETFDWRMGFRVNFLPSVRSSSNVPFTCEKHHCTSPPSSTDRKYRDENRPEY